LNFPADRDVFASVETAMIYRHVLNKGGRGVTSPLDFPQFDSGATLTFRDILRLGANEQDSQSPREVTPKQYG
jgi:hypothetical protein